jgi:hypothetical protein
MSAHDYMLHDYATGDVIRPATHAEHDASSVAARDDRGAGVILVDGRACYVPDVDPDPATTQMLEDFAACVSEE